MIQVNRDISLSGGLDLDTLEQCATAWARRLRVADWECEVLVCRRYRISEEKSADCTYNVHSKRATIKLSHPDDWAPDDEYSRDMEDSLVHELLHLHFVGWHSNERDEEQAVCQISRALLEGYGRWPEPFMIEAGDG